jgi:O-antigen ligase
MSHVRPQPIAVLVRVFAVAGLLGLAGITLADRGTSVMYALPGSLFYWAAVLAPALILVVRAGLAPEPLRLPERPWLWLIAASAVVLIGSALTSPYRQSCLQWTALPLSALAVFLLMYDWRHSAPDNDERFARYAAITGGVLMMASTGYWVADVIGFTRAEFFSATLFEMRNPHPLGHSNYTAGLALLSLPWLFLAGIRRRGLPRLLALTGTGLALLALFTSGSRGGLVGLAALGVAGLAAAQMGWRRFALLAGAAVLAAGVLAVANPRVRALLGPVDPLAEPNASTVQRHAMLQAGLHLGADRPLLGWGLGTTPLVYPRYRATLEGGAENILQLHSTPVEIWAGLGGAGLLLLGAFSGLVFLSWRRAPAAAATLAGYGVFALTDFQLDVPIFAFACVALAAQLAAPESAAASARIRLGLAAAVLAVMGLILALCGHDRTPELNSRALGMGSDPGSHAQAVALLRESLALNPDQEIAHFNLGWLLLVTEPAAAELHFRAALRLVPDKGGAYFGLGLAALNQGHVHVASEAFALECLNDPRFLASPWWHEPAIAAQRDAATAAFTRLAQAAITELPAATWAAQQAGRLLELAPRLGSVSAGPELNYRRERTGYPVLMRNHNLPPLVDLYIVREDPRFPASVPGALPPKGWLPSPLLLKLLDGGPASGH